MNKLKKVFSASVMMMTVLSMSLMSVVAVNAAADIEAGDLIKIDGVSSVYYYGEDGKRYVFPDENTYFSWYSDFSGVVTISQEDLESIQIGGNITMRPGTFLVKITTDPKVYAVEPDGVLRPVADEAAAEALYGDDWASQIVDVPDSFFVNYTITDDELTGDEYPAGSLVQLPGGADVYYINADGEAQAIDDEAAFYANRFEWRFLNVADEDYELPAEGDAITGAESSVIDTAESADDDGDSGDEEDEDVASGVSVALSSNTSLAQNIPGGSSVEFTTVNFTASADGNVTIESIQVSGYELGDYSLIKGVAFYDDGVKQGTSRSLGSDGEATFNFANGITIEAGETKPLVIKAKVDNSGGAPSGNFALGIEEAADITTSGSSVSGSFPIVGNAKSVSDVSVGEVELDDEADETDTVKLGEDNITVADFSLTPDYENVLWHSFRLENKGNNDEMVENLKLYVEGEEVADGEMSDGYAVFSFENYEIEDGETVDVEVKGDIASGDIDDDVKFVVDDVDDFSFTGKTYGFPAKLIDDNGTDLNQGITVTLETGDISLDMDNSEDGTPSQEVRSGTNNVELATLKITSNGEEILIDGINADESDDFYIEGTATTSYLTDVVLRDVDGGSYDLSMKSGADKIHFGYDGELTIDKGETRTFKMEADIEDEIPNGEELKVVFKADALDDIEGQESGARTSDFDVSPSEVTSAKTTIEEASLGWQATPLTDKTIVKGTEDVLVYRAGLEAGDSSYVELKSVKFTDSGGENALDDDFISNMTLKLNGEEVESLSGDIDEDNDTLKFENLDENNIVSAGEIYVLEVYATFANYSTTSEPTLSLKVNAKSDVDIDDEDGDEVSSANHTNDVSPSRDVTLGAAGDLKVDLLTDDATANDDFYLLAGGSETSNSDYLGELKFTTKNEQVSVTKLALQNGSDATISDIAYVRLYDKDGDLVKEESNIGSNGGVEFDLSDYDGLSADNSSSLFIEVVAKSMNADGDAMGTASFNKGIQYTISDVEAKGAVTGEDITMTATNTSPLVSWGYYCTSSTSNKASTTGSILNSVVNAMDDNTSLSSGGNEIIGKYTFVFDNNENRTSDNEELKAMLDSLKLTIDSSASTSATSVQAYIEGDSGNKTDATSSAGTIDFTTLSDNANLVDGDITIVIQAELTVEETSGEYLETEIDLSAGNFVYNGNDGSGKNWTNPLIKDETIYGAKVSN